MTSSPRLPIVPCSALDLVCATRRRLRSTARLPPISRTRLCTISSDIASHRIASHRIVSHRLTSHRLYPDLPHLPHLPTSTSPQPRTAPLSPPNRQPPIRKASEKVRPNRGRGES
ncbi:unnamed protein product [Diplocarpon coronariae]